MKARLLRLWESLTTGLWLIPSLFVIAAAVAAAVLVELDQARGPAEPEHLTWLFAGGADSARAILSLVASASITVMGVVFSITIVALTLASTQFTPRVLYAFTRDRGNQVVLGIFTGVFTYSLLVQRSVRSAEEGLFVPTLAVTAGIVLGVVAVGALIFFIHHIASSIQASHVIASIAEATLPMLERPFPDGVGLPYRGPAGVPDGDFAPLPSSAAGYVEVIDGDGLLRIAERHDVILRMDRGPGDFVAADGALASVYPAARATPELTREVNRHFALGRRRTMQQDPEFGVRQLMDIAVKALSPGINDPTTAVTCIDYLDTILRGAAGREDPPVLRAARSGALRLVARGPTFRTLVSHGFDQIRQHAARDVAVTLRLLTALGDIGARTPDVNRRRVLWDQVEMIMAGANRNIPAYHDRRVVNERLDVTARALAQDPEPLRLSLPAEESALLG